MEYVALRKIRKTFQRQRLWNLDGEDITPSMNKFLEEKEYMRKYH